MGTQSSKDFKDKKFIHHYRFMENKLLVFLTETYTTLTFELFLNRQKFRCFAQETIALPSGAIYMIGGRNFCSNQVPEDFHIFTNSRMNMYITNEVYKVNLNKHTDMQIELSQSRQCKPLPEPRHGHVLLYVSPYIYVIGGQTPIGPAYSCLRLHTKTKEWSNIQDFNMTSKALTNFSGVNVNDKKLFIFDNNAFPLPNVYQYNIETDMWVHLIISYKNKNVQIPASINSSIYHIADSKLLILSGEHTNENRKQTGYSYFFDIEDERIEDYRAERTLDFMISDKQGARDFRKEDRVFVHFGKNAVDFFDKRLGICDKVDPRDCDSLEAQDITRFGCCSSRKGPAYLTA